MVQDGEDWVRRTRDDSAYLLNWTSIAVEAWSVALALCEPEECQVWARSLPHTPGDKVDSRDPCRPVPDWLGHHRLLRSQHPRLGSRQG